MGASDEIARLRGYAATWRCSTKRQVAAKSGAQPATELGLGVYEGSVVLPKPDRRQQLVAFFSADMSNVADFKNRHQARYSGDELIPPRWPRYFSEVFDRILQSFDEELRIRHIPREATLLSRPQLWKINGSQLLFREIIVPGEEGLKWLSNVVEAFASTVTRIDEEILPDGCGLRGCVWTAGFPIRNKQIRVATSSIPILRSEDFSLDEALPDIDSGLFYHDDEGLIDYLGPDMDLGFRLAAVAPPGRVVGSLDAAYFLAKRPQPPYLYHVGWRSLRGIAGGAPYPIFWVSQQRGKATRHPWEVGTASDELARYLSSSALQPADLFELAEQYWKQLRDYFNRPYTEPNDITLEHQRIWSDIPADDASDLDPIILNEYPQE